MTFKNIDDYFNWVKGIKKEVDCDYHFQEQHRYILELLKKLEETTYINKSCEDCTHFETDVCNTCILLEYNQEVYTDLFERKKYKGD